MVRVINILEFVNLCFFLKKYVKTHNCECYAQLNKLNDRLVNNFGLRNKLNCNLIMGTSIIKNHEIFFPIIVFEAIII